MPLDLRGAFLELPRFPTFARYRRSVPEALDRYDLPRWNADLHDLLRPVERSNFRSSLVRFNAAGARRRQLCLAHNCLCPCA